MVDQPNDILSAPAETQPAQPAVAQPAPATTSPDSLYKEQLSAIKNEDGLQKYASVNDVLASVPHREEFINTLKEEKQHVEQQLMEAKLELEKRMSVEDAMSQIASTPSIEQTAHDAGLSREDVYSAMKEYETAKSVESNRKSVSDTLVKHYGDEAKAQEALASKLNDLGMSRQELATLAGSNPKAAYKLLELDVKAPAAVNKAVVGDVNADAIESSFNKEIPKSKGIMLGASSADVMNEWRLSGEAVKQDLGM